MDKRAVIYCRRSHEKADGASLEAQESACRKWAGRKGWEIIDVFADDGESGLTTYLHNRPGGASMLERLGQGDVQAIIIWKASRLARAPVVWNAARAELDERAVALAVVDRAVDDDMSEDKRNTLEAEKDADDAKNSEKGALDIREWTSGGRHEHAAQGMWAGGRPPFGWVIDKTMPTHLAEKPADAATVRLIFERAAGGDTLRNIARLLDDEHRPTPLMSNPKSKGKPSGRWTRTTVSHIVANPAYKGLLRYGKAVSIYQGRGRKSVRRPRTEADDYAIHTIPVEPLVAPELWQAAQDAVAKRQGPKRTLGTAPDYMLAGRIGCVHCGRAYATSREPVGKVHKRGEGRHGNDYIVKTDGTSYRHRKGEGHCTTKKIMARKIEPLVWATLQQAIGDPENLRALIERHTAQQRRDADKVAHDIEKARERQQAASLAVDRILNLVKRGTISPAEAEKSIKADRAEVLAAGRELERLEHLSPTKLPDDFAEQWVKAVRSVLVKEHAMPPTVKGVSHNPDGSVTIRGGGDIPEGEPVTTIIVEADTGEAAVEISAALVDRLVWEKPDSRSLRRHVMEVLQAHVDIELVEPGKDGSDVRAIYLTTNLTGTVSKTWEADRTPSRSSSIPGLPLKLTLPVDLLGAVL